MISVVRVLEKLRASVGKERRRKPAHEKLLQTFGKDERGRPDYGLFSRRFFEE